MCLFLILISDFAWRGAWFCASVEAKQTMYLLVKIGLFIYLLLRD